MIFDIKILKSVIQSSYLQLLIIVLLTLIAFSNIFANQFAGDDLDFILGWPETQNWQHLPDLLQGAVPKGHEGVYRPFRAVLYILAQQMWGQNLFAYHLFSITVHLFVILLLYFFIKKICQNQLIAFLTTLFFALHPIHVEAITFITSSFDMVSVILILISLNLYLRFNSKRLNKENLAIYMMSIICAGLSFFIYEMTLTLPIIIVFIDLIRKELNIKNWRQKITFYIPYFALVFLYIFIRFFILNIVSRAPYQADSFYLTQLANFKVILKYFQLLLLPFGYNISHTLPGEIAAHTLPELNRKAIESQNLFEIPIIISLTLIMSLIYWAKKSWFKKPLISFAIGWFFITLLPVANILPNSALLTERYMYIPSIGFCFLLSYLIFQLSKYSFKTKIIAYVLIFSLALIYLTQTWQRNKTWKNNIILWETTSKQSPNISMVIYKLGSAYKDDGQIDKAKNAYLQAIKLSPNFAPAYNNLGVIAEKETNFQLAKKFYLQAIQADPNIIEPYNNLGVLAHRDKNYQQAISYYLKALEISPNYPKAKYNLSQAYNLFANQLTEQESFDRALDYYQKALTLDPINTEVLNNMGSFYANQGLYQKGIAYYQQALQIDPNFEQAKNNMEKALNLLNN